jgi:maltoporin
MARRLSHRLSAQYGTGAASNFSNPGNGTTIPDPTPFIDQSQAASFHGTSALSTQRQIRHYANRRLSADQGRQSTAPMEPVAVVWRAAGSLLHEVPLAGARGRVRLLGWLHTDSPIGQYDGWLRKFTIAPQIGAGRKFESRPVLRVFLTYADWSDGFRGSWAESPI